LGQPNRWFAHTFLSLAALIFATAPTAAIAAVPDVPTIEGPITGPGLTITETTTTNAASAGATIELKRRRA
jgi:hypothetical protein